MIPNVARAFIVIPVHNRRDTTLRCLGCLAAQTYPSVSVVVVDDSSSDGTSEAVAERHPDVTVLRGSGDLWWTASINLGVEWCLARADDGDYIITLNDDTEFDALYVERIVGTAHGLPGALIGSLVVDDEEPAKVVDAGVRIDWLTARQWDLGMGRTVNELHETTGLVHGVDALSGRGTLIPCAVFRDVGLYDARRLPHYGADYEFSVRAQRAGHCLYIDHGAMVVTPSGGSPPNGSRPPTLSRIADRLSSRRSTLNPWYRFQFARLVCPWYALPTYLLADAIRIVGRSVVRMARRTAPPIIGSLA